MWKQIALGGAITAAVVGVGTASLATSGSVTSGQATPASSSSADRPGRIPGHALARRALHGTWVTRDGSDGSGFVTHSAIRGTVTAVSATSISVKAADNVTQTYVVNSDTKVRQRSDGKGSDSSISAIKTGDKVGVIGKGDPLTATGIIEGTK
jgi:hypothetical protein